MSLLTSAADSNPPVGPPRGPPTRPVGPVAAPGSPGSTPPPGKAFSVPPGAAAPFGRPRPGLVLLGAPAPPKPTDVTPGPALGIEPACTVPAVSRAYAAGAPRAATRPTATIVAAI